jgi:L-fucose isomerase-like protein
VGLRGARIGAVGDPPTGFEPCDADADELQRLTGMTLERLPLTILFDTARRLPAATVDEHSARARRTLDVGADVADQGLTESMALYGGLRELAAAHGWAAIATRCWPECMTEFGGAACTPMAMLTEDGVPAVCEADVHGAVTALVLRELAGSDPFVADLVDADPTDGTSVVWHCGVASASLAAPGERLVGITHPNRHRALASQFALRPGRVTVARLSRAGGRWALVVGTGELLDRPRPFSGTCGVLRWDRPVDDVLATVFGHGIEHHLALVHGDHRAALVSLAAAWALPLVELGGPP